MQAKRFVQIATLTVTTLITMWTGISPATAQTEEAPRASVITCSLMAHYPHNSGHVKGTINVVSDIICSANVDSIYIATGLRGTQSSNGWNQAYVTNYAESNAAKPCVSGTYWGTASATVTFPSGYSPRTQSKEAAGATRSIQCPSRGSEEKVETVVLDTFTAEYIGEE